MSTLFVSHSHADKKFVERLRRDLEHAGHYTWIDVDEIKVGESLIEKLRDGIDFVDFVIAIISANSISSAWVRKELDVAMTLEMSRRDTFVLPVVIDGVQLPGFIEGKLFADFRTPERYDDSLHLLLRSIERSTPRSLALRERVTLDARTIRQLRREVRYAIGYYGIDILGFYRDTDIHIIREMAELERVALDGFATSVRFLIHVIATMPRLEGVHMTILLGTCLLIQRIVPLYESGIPSKLSIKNESGQVIPYAEDLKDVRYPEGWQRVIGAVKDCFREGEYQGFYAGALFFADLYFRQASEFKAAKSTMSYEAMFIPLYGLLYEIAREAELRYFHLHNQFWNLVWRVLRSPFGVPVEDDWNTNLERLDQMEPGFISRLFSMLGLTDDIITRHRSRLPGADARTSLDLMVLELQSRYIFTGYYDEAVPKLVFGVSAD